MAMKRQEYAELLKHPKWQKLRLKIFERDDWTCKRCGATEKTLHVHHFLYEEGCLPWEADTSILMTLCEDCHKDEHELLNEYKSLINVIEMSCVPFCIDRSLLRVCCLKFADTLRHFEARMKYPLGEKNENSSY